VAGIAALPRGRGPVLLLAFLAFYVLLHVAAHGYPRYRLPAMPALFLVAGHGWAAWRLRAIDRRHRAAAGAVALVLGLSVGPSLLRWVTQPWPPPWFAGAGVEGGQETPAAGETPQQEGR
jgi:peptidoglycan/LPS O-acetylase OafA/YrhL